MAKGSKKRPAPIFALPVVTMRTLTFLTGLGLTIREGVIGGQEHPSRYVLYATMMGLSMTAGNGENIVRLFRRDDEDGK